ncbi:MAG: hypothetical protein ACK5U4_19595 [Rhodospirillales bacterium]|jgi:hypothetical protein
MRFPSVDQTVGIAASRCALRVSQISESQSATNASVEAMRGIGVSVVVVPLYSAVLTWVMLRGRRGIKRHS